MSINLEKLTPAPWVESFPGYAVLVNQAGGVHVASLHNSEPSLLHAEAEANANFIAIARNAFDVLMRRGWGVSRDDDGWHVSGILGLVNTERPDHPVTEFVERYFCAGHPCPLEMLVEADRWYAKHVEKAAVSTPI